MHAHCLALFDSSILYDIYEGHYRSARGIYLDNIRDDMLVLSLQLDGQLVDVLGILVGDLLSIVPRILHL
jgi:hypothetical protein